MFLEDSSIVGSVTDDKEEDYRDHVENFKEWCNSKHLHLNLNQGAVGGLPVKCEPPQACCYKGGRSGDCGHLQVSRGAVQHRTGLVKHQGPLQVKTMKRVHLRRFRSIIV